MTEERWIGIKELSEYLGVKEVTIRNWIKKGNDLVIGYNILLNV